MFKLDVVKQILLIIIVVLTGTNIQAQWYFHAVSERSYNSNPFYLPDSSAESSWITSLEFGLGKDLEKSTIYYTADYVAFDNFSSRNFYWHQLDLSAYKKNVAWGFLVEGRINNADDNLYNYADWQAYLNFKFNWNKFICYNSMTMDYIDFPNMPEMNTWNYSYSFKSVRSFPSRTSILSGMNFNFKQYVNVYILPDSSTPADSTSMRVLGGGVIGGGRGGSSFIGSSDVETPSVSNMELWVKVSQSITKTTGMAVQYRQQFILSGTNRVLIGNVQSYQLDNLIFDDPLSYESRAIGGELTQLLPKDIMLKGKYFVMSKQYPTQGIYTDSENYIEETERDDDYSNITVSLTKTFKRLFGKPHNSAVIDFRYVNVVNSSNSFWYDYSNEVYSLNISLNF